jgi:phage/conjugal plasmid C-4 type zinc finger TraR family protein
MADEMDRAQAREEEMRADALAEHQRRAHGDATIPSARQCAICDEDIPARRRLAIPGVQTCVECQRDLEREDYIVSGGTC